MRDLIYWNVYPKTKTPLALRRTKVNRRYRIVIKIRVDLK